MRNLLRWVTVMWSAVGWATSTAEVTVFCPVCGQGVQSVEAMSTNTMGGTDSDLLERALGDQLFMVMATTCPRDGYSGYPGDFNRSPDGGVSLGRGLAAAILDGGLQLPEAGLGDELPASAKLDLMAQRLELQDAGPEEVAQTRLRAAWAFRVEDATLRPLSPCQALSPKGKKPLPNRAEYELELAKDFATSAQATADRRRRDRLVCAAFLYRAHGEAAAVRALFPLLRQALGAKVWGPLERSLEVSLTNEQRQQRLAMTAWQRALAKPTSATDRAERVFWVYLLGETARRVGDSALALTQLAAASKDPSAPEWLKTLADHQLGELQKVVKQE